MLPLACTHSGTAKIPLGLGIVGGQFDGLFSICGARTHPICVAFALHFHHSLAFPQDLVGCGTVSFYTEHVRTASFFSACFPFCQDPPTKTHDLGPKKKKKVRFNLGAQPLSFPLFSELNEIPNRNMVFDYHGGPTIFVQTEPHF